ncbi:MAG: class I SAM-dependent methyltransferase [Flavobacteriaceae bacterium]
MKDLLEHYDSQYFNDFQKPIGILTGKTGGVFFGDYISKHESVLDFGCGGGFILQQIVCEKKFGVEVNEFSRAIALKNGVDCKSDLSEIKDNSVDVVISNHCLEHVICPGGIIKELFKKLKAGGKIIIIVPCESYKNKYLEEDINNHLYTFSPMNLGNLLKNARFEKISVKTFFNKWPPKYNFFYKVFGLKLFMILSKIYGYVNRKTVNIVGYAEKP